MLCTFCHAAEQQLCCKPLLFTTKSKLISWQFKEPLKARAATAHARGLICLQWLHCKGCCWQHYHARPSHLQQRYTTTAPAFKLACPITTVFADCFAGMLTCNCNHCVNSHFFILQLMPAAATSAC